VQGWHGSYHSYPEIIGYFQDTIVPAAPSIAATFSIGSKHEGRDLMVVRVTGGAKTMSGGLPASNGLPAIWVQSLLHAREHLTGASLAYALERILTDYGTSDWAINFGAQPLLCHSPPPHCKTTSLVTCLVNPFELVGILLGQLTRCSADD